MHVELVATLALLNGSLVCNLTVGSIIFFLIGFCLLIISIHLSLYGHRERVGVSICSLSSTLLSHYLG